MSSTHPPLKWILAALSFVLPLLVYLLTSSNSLMFDDAGEFALVISLASIAHPPGTPAYILFGHLWEKIGLLFTHNRILLLTMFSGICVSVASLLLYFTVREILLKNDSDRNEKKAGLIALFTTLIFAFSTTAWAWANTVEVYAFHILTVALTVFGLTFYQTRKTLLWLVIAGAGIGLGLANHHLTMIVFLPFVPFFFTNDLFRAAEILTAKKKGKEEQRSVFLQYTDALRQRNFWMLAGASAVFMLVCYTWMFIRAQQEYPFMFGQPNTLSGMIYHLKGGSYSKNLTETSKSIISSRIPYFVKLFAVQFYLFLPFLILGIVQLFSSRLKKLAYASIGFFLILFLYQINNNQWASTDAYLLPPFFFLSIPIAFGIARWYDRWKLAYVVPVLIVAQIAINFKEHDRREYNVSASLMHLLDVSAPKNSVILISDWTTVIQYYYYRIVEGFRPDLVVLNYDVKFTHCKMLENQYPEFYKKIKPEYDHFIDELGKEHPEQLYNTGCDLSTVPLSDSFRAMILKIESVCKSEGHNFLTDPKAHFFFAKEKFYDPRRFVSGCFMSTVPGDSLSSAEFLRMDEDWMSSPMLFNDPGALDKLVDFQAMLDQHIDFYTVNNDSSRLVKADQARDKILKLQREMKKSMSFAYKIK